MKKTDRQKRPFPVPTVNRIRKWLPGCIVTLLVLTAVALLVMPRLIEFASIKERIQTAVTEQTGGRIDFTAIDLSYFPRLSLEFRQVSLTIPDLADGTVAALRVEPQLLSLLRGDLRSARVELDSPRFSLELPETKPDATPAQPSAPAESGKRQAAAITPLGLAMIAGMDLQVDNGRLAIGRTGQKPTEIKGISLTGSVETAGGRIKVKLGRLALAEPALELTGALTLVATSPAITLDLSGSNIDVDAVRSTALALAGDIAPIVRIFDYLGGGRVPQIRFTSHGENLAELGKLHNILITGQLQDGQISIPQIDLDLTEVAGEVNVSQGILQGTGLSARLDQSTGRDGTLQIGLTRENDLFQLDLMLRADLGQAQPILQRIVHGSAIAAELDKIAHLQGSGYGRLTLGDNLHDISAKIDVSELNLSADYQRLPLPITIAAGQLIFSKRQLSLEKFSGSLGRSQFADLSGRFLWENDLALDIGSGRLDLDMAELYPWLASLEGFADRFKEVKKVTGGLELANLKLKGKVDRPAEWRFSSTGKIKDLSVETGSFPDTINFASGGIQVDTQQFTFDKLKTSSQDAALILSGSLKGFPRRLDRLDLSLDGSMGPQSVAWLSNRLKVPETYAIRAPLSIGNAQISWRPDSSISFNGSVSIAEGPAITAEVDYRPEQLRVNRLHIKDRYSDAVMVFDFNADRRDIKFVGSLQSETLHTLFVDRRFDSGRLQGNFAVSIPQGGQAAATATGQLTGEKLPVLLPSGDTAYIERIALQADGSQVQVDIAKLTWRNLTWEPVGGTLSFAGDRAEFRLAGARLCGIDSQGLLSSAGDEFSLDLTLEGRDLDVATSYTCLTEGRSKATGRLDFSSRITAKGKMDELVKAMKGPLRMTLKKGVIERDKLVARILAVLNVTEIVKGRLPNLGATGFAYTTMTLQGEFKNGKLIIDKYFMDGETLDLVGSGEIRLEDRTLEVELLAAPFKTVDTVIKYIPGVNYLLGGSLIAIPISIAGALDDPTVEVMSVSAVGSSLYNLAERTLTSPFKLFETIIPLGGQKGK